MASRLPVELYRSVVEFVGDIPTLRTIALTSQILNVEAERVLYRSISGAYDTDTYTRLLLRLTSCSRVARLVRHLQIVLRSYISGEHEFWKLVPLALRSLPNLKTLVFRGVGECRTDTLPSDCAFQLNHLDWACPSSRMGHFLASQKSLKTVLNLQLKEEEEMDIPAEALPNLMELSGNFSAVRTLLPGRQVTRLHWISSAQDGRNPDVSLLVESLTQLRKFQLGGHFHRHPLGLIAKHLVNVTTLELFGVQPDDLEHLSQLPRLEELKISSQWGEQKSPIPEVTIDKIFAGTSKLSIVDVALPVYWPLVAYFQAYQRWERDSKQTKIINTGVVASTCI